MLTSGVHLPKVPQLPVLLGDQLLSEGGEFDVQVQVVEIEVGGQHLLDLVPVPAQGEGAGLVGPLDAVEVQDPGRTPPHWGGRTSPPALQAGTHDPRYGAGRLLRGRTYGFRRGPCLAFYWSCQAQKLPSDRLRIQIPSMVQPTGTYAQWVPPPPLGNGARTPRPNGL